MDTQRDPATGNGPDGAGTAPGPERPRLTVAVLTYLRNAYLAELLPALVEQAESAAGRARTRSGNGCRIAGPGPGRSS